eukprot:TRINITY_DN25118_c0_g1_i1.p1 TRINITY_DN25118_c0_g1~~TRINITY_DN25118_c0_g1_i1.p1  ORF type:complete len:765 (-),score=239.70 TRINITY_DN25118_c0_g1_i1:156-2450(-)
MSGRRHPTRSRLDRARDDMSAFAYEQAQSEVRLEVALAEAARFKEEARESLEAAIKDRSEEAKLLAAVEKNLAEATEEASQEHSRKVAQLWSQNENSKRRAELDLDESLAAFSARRSAAESAIAAAADDRLLSSNKELQESRLAALQARLDVARRSMRESSAARTALEDREAAAELAYAETSRAQQLALSEILAQGSAKAEEEESRMQQELQFVKSEESILGMRAETRLAAAAEEVKAWQHWAMQKGLSAEEQAEELQAAAIDCSQTASFLLKDAEMRAAAAWKGVEEELGITKAEHDIEVKQAEEHLAEEEAAACERVRAARFEGDTAVAKFHREARGLEAETSKTLAALERKKTLRAQETAAEIASLEASAARSRAEKCQCEEEAIAWALAEQEATQTFCIEAELEMQEIAKQRLSFETEIDKAIERCQERSRLANQRMELASREAAEEADQSILAQQELHATAEARENLLLSNSLALQEEALAVQVAAEERLLATREEVSEAEAEKSAWAESASHAALEEVEGAKHEAAESLAHFQHLEASEQAAEEAYRRTATTLLAAKANADELSLAEERAVRAYSEAHSEAKSEGAQAQERWDHRREQARLKVLEAEAHAHEEQEQRVTLSRERWKCEERRAEAAAEQCRQIQQEEAESEAKRESDMHEMLKVAEEQASEALKQELAAKAVLSKYAHSFRIASARWPAASESMFAPSPADSMPAMDLPASPFTPPRSVVPAGDETPAPTSPIGMDAHSDRSISPTKGA